jgi:hypothetical protein
VRAREEERVSNSIQQYFGDMYEDPEQVRDRHAFSVLYVYFCSTFSVFASILNSSIVFFFTQTPIVWWFMVLAAERFESMHGRWPGVSPQNEVHQ